jgi:outer membrane protein OmpA-like peptidoglycan-associated protein
LAFNSDSYSADHPALSPEGRQIYFDFDKFKVISDAAQEFNKLVGVMNEHPGMVIKIESLTDSKGAKDYNRFLSGKGAKSTKDFIAKKKYSIDKTTITSTKKSQAQSLGFLVYKVK